MKNSLKISIVFYVCFLTFTAGAQKTKQDVTEKNNVIKINLSALTFKNISIQYETRVGKKTSLALNVHSIPFGNIPYQSAFEKLIVQNFIQYDKFKLGSFGVVPEVRFYVGKKGVLHGFYLAPFVSYNNYKINLPISYNNNTKTGIFDGSLNAYTGGLQLGSQFRLSKSLTLDWWILGPNYGSANGTLNFASTLTPSEQTDLSNALEKIKNDAPLKTIQSYKVSSTGAIVTAKGPWGGLRGLGINLGVRF